jgi:hypothetical protein
MIDKRRIRMVLLSFSLLSAPEFGQTFPPHTHRERTRWAPASTVRRVEFVAKLDTTRGWLAQRWLAAAMEELASGSETRSA